MLKIEREGAHPNRITLTRGDTAVLKLKIYDPCKQYYSLHGKDNAILTIKETAEDSHPLVVVVADKLQQFKLEHEDTAGLNCGTYIYDVLVIMEDGSVSTVVPPSDFVIASEVTW